jgi:hypothetical protein
MKKSLLFIAVLFSCVSKAQNYIPLPLDTNHYWSEYFTGWQGPQTLFSSVYKYKIKDTLINSMNYKRLINEGYSPSNGACYSCGALLRQDSTQKKVYVLMSGQEYFLYNFSKNIGDTLKVCDISGTSPIVVTRTLTAVDSTILFDNKYHRRYHYFAGSFTGAQYVIEGVGGENGLLYPYYVPLETGRSMICLTHVNSPISTIYMNPYFAQSGCTPYIMGNRIIENADKIKIYPNPTSEKLFIENHANYDLVMRDVLGKDITIKVSSKNCYDLSNLNKGIYFLNIYEGKKLISVEKIIKE